MFCRNFVSIVVLAASFAAAGEYNPTLSIGDRAPQWNLPGVDGREHALADLEKTKLVVVVFISNSCDVSRDYEPRIVALAKKYAGQVAVVAINANRQPDDSLAKMKQRAEGQGFPFAYLRDDSQQIAKDYGASFTPEFFLLGPDRTVVYMGGMDDSSTADQVKNRYLEPAIEAALQGLKPEKPETPAIGCRIPYPRERRQ